ncbi:Alcohol acetyltransferase [Kalmusia sp. IMI 367209]|nr:Alcohol acetyltransferase [Kalmusia sp. IMI 367209]
MLSAIPLNEDKQHPQVYFARVPSIDLRTCVDFIARKHSPEDGERDKELEQVLQHQHSRDFKDALGSKPFWRIVVLHDPTNQSTFTVTWVYHHALGDGTCGLVFHRTLLSALQAASDSHSQGTVDPIVASPSTPHPPSKTYTLPHILAFLHQGHPRLRTLQAAIATAILSSIDAEKYDSVAGSGPVSLRSMLKWDGGSLSDEFVLALAEYKYTHVRASTSPSAFWDEARAVRAAIQTELAKKGSDNVVSLLRYMSNMHKFFTDKVGKDRSISFETSNLGVLKVESGKEAGWRIGRCVFSQSPNVTSSPVVCTVITGGDGCCVLAFSWLEGVLGGELVGRIVESVGRQIEALVIEEE